MTGGPDIRASALVVVDMQNDFVHPDGNIGCLAREYPDRGIDIGRLILAQCAFP